jgi:hypothetical protein
MRVTHRRFLVGLTVLAIVAAIGFWSSANMLAHLKAIPAAGAVSRVEETVNDAALTAKIKAKMSLDDSVRARSVDVSTRDAVVTLGGAVPSPTAKARVIELARETAGVKVVLDHLVIDEPAGSLSDMNASLRAQVVELQTNIAIADATVADLRGQIEKLQARLVSADATGSAQAATIHAVVEDLVNTQRATDSGTVARDIARIVLNRAAADAGANDRQVKLARAVFARGEIALQAGRAEQARSEFRTALDLAELALTPP